jgi:hypothetical protein
MRAAGLLLPAAVVPSWIDPGVVRRRTGTVGDAASMALVVWPDGGRGRLAAAHRLGVWMPEELGRVVQRFTDRQYLQPR